MANMSDKEIRLECIKQAKNDIPKGTQLEVLGLAKNYWLFCMGYEPKIVEEKQAEAAEN